MFGEFTSCSQRAASPRRPLHVRVQRIRGYGHFLAQTLRTPGSVMMCVLKIQNYSLNFQGHF